MSDHYSFDLVFGIVMTALGGYLYKILIERRKISRLKQVLLIDCVATINKLLGTGGRQSAHCLLGELSDLVKKNSGRQIQTGENGIDDACDLISGFVLSGPDDASMDLIAHLSTDKSRFLVYYHDRWSLFFKEEASYAKAVDDLLSVVKDSSALGERLQREYWERVNTDLCHLEGTAIQLCHFAFKLLRLMVSSELQIQEFSSGRWRCWEEFNREWLPFKSFVESGDMAPFRIRFSSAVVSITG